MFASSKPKFAFELTINELANIPQISGSCYIEVQVRDGKLMKPSLSGVLDRKPPKESGSPSKGNDQEKSGASSKASTSAGGNISTTTSAKHIHNFKCSFDYKLRCNLKFPVKRRDNLIDSKHLLIRVFYVNDHHEVTPLGRLEVNLTEYLNYSEPQTSKYLLKQSKVNSLLSLTIFLSELPSNFDFHTQLQVNESVTQTTGLSAKSSDQNMRHSNASSKAAPSGTWSIPQFGENFSGSQEKKGKDDKDGNKDLGKEDTENGLSKRPPLLDSKKPLIMDPIVSRLYSKIMESSWDPELHALLEYTPEKSIEDIFYNSENPLGLNERLLKKYLTWSKDQRVEQDSDGNELQEINGLINEKVFRSDLKSWAVR